MDCLRLSQIRCRYCLSKHGEPGSFDRHPVLQIASAEGRSGMTANDHQLWDCLVIGGGPAGLTAALFLARFRRTVLVIDGGRSRAAGIPRSHNHPGFIDGISGETLLQTLRKQASQYGAEIKSGNVVSLEVTDDGFKAQTEAGEFGAACVVLAAGIADVCPDIINPSSTSETGHIRYCPGCDGFEAADKKIAV